MKLQSIPLALMIFVLLFGGIAFSSAMNWWRTETQKIPVTFTEGEAAGQYNPADIRGSYTFGDVSRLFEVPLADLQTAFRLPADADPAAYPLKSLETQFADLPVEMGTGAVRLYVAFYKGLPYEISANSETYLFPEAAETLKAHGGMTPEQVAYLEGHILVDGAAKSPEASAPTAADATPAGAASSAGADATPAAAPAEHTPPARTVTGKTTFQELLDWGLSRETIEGILGGSMPAPQTVVKNYVTEKGLEFSTYRAQLQAALDQP